MGVSTSFDRRSWKESRELGGKGTKANKRCMQERVYTLVTWGAFLRDLWEAVGSTLRLPHGRDK